MVSYSLDSNIRQQVINKFVGITIIFAIVFDQPSVSEPIYAFLIEHLDANTFWGYFADIVTSFKIDIGTSALVLFALLSYLFNRWFWHWPLIGAWLNIPNLNGKWVGALERPDVPENDAEKALPVIVNIKQNFSQMSLVIENPVLASRSGRTESKSNMLGISGTKDTKFVLRDGYEFPGRDQKVFFGTTEWTIYEDEYGPYMSGKYVSSALSIGSINVCYVHRGQKVLKGKIRRVRDYATGRDYLAICVPTRHVKKFRKTLGKEIPKHEAFQCSKNRIDKDGPEYYLTVVSPEEMEKLKEAQIEQIIGREQEDVTYVLQCNGRVKSGDASAYYIIVLSPHIAFRRVQAGLPKTDLHITIGYDKEDVANRPKSLEMRLSTNSGWFGRRIYR